MSKKVGEFIEELDDLHVFGDEITVSDADGRVYTQETSPAGSASGNTCPWKPSPAGSSARTNEKQPAPPLEPDFDHERSAAALGRDVAQAEQLILTLEEAAGVRTVETV